MLEPFFQALEGGWVDVYTIPLSPVEKLTDVRLEMNQQFLAFFIDGVGVLDFSVQLFDQLAQLLVVHGEAPPSEDGPVTSILHPYSRTFATDSR
jgi:hypothetical protein